MDKAFQDEYTESASIPPVVLRAPTHTDHSTEDLEGLKVSHDFEGMEEGEARILTLKDSRILDNEGVSRCVVPQALTHDFAQRTSSRISTWPKRSERRIIRSSRLSDETTLAMTMRSSLLVLQG